MLLYLVPSQRFSPTIALWTGTAKERLRWLCVHLDLLLRWIRLKQLERVAIRNSIRRLGMCST